MSAIPPSSMPCYSCLPGVPLHALGRSASFACGLPAAATLPVRPLLVVPGGPGLPHDYLETLEAVAKTGRRVVLFDPVGTGRSSSFGQQDPPLATPASLAHQAAAVAAAVLGSTDQLATVAAHHVLGHGTGAPAALLYAELLAVAAAETGSGGGGGAVASLVLASPLFGSPPPLPPASGGGKVASVVPWRGSVGAAVGWQEALPPQPMLLGLVNLKSIPQPAAAGGGVGAAEARPACFGEAEARWSRDLYEAWSPATPGALAAAAAAVAALCGPVPTLLTSGGGRELPEVRASVDAAWGLLSAVAAGAPRGGVAAAKAGGMAGGAAARGAVAVEYASSGHAPHLDEREAVLGDLFAFFAAADATELAA